MKESISDNLKEKLTKTNRFDVMDVQLLRQINPGIQFADLTEKEVTPLARKLNCEAAIIGRYIIKQKGDAFNALIQIEAVNAVSNESIVIKSEYADLDGEIFKRVENLAKTVAGEFVAKLPAVSAAKNTRSNSLEKMIYRIEHPPKGYLDTLGFSVPGLNEKDSKKVRFKPEFDIDIFEYELYLPEETKQVEYRYDTWGRTFTPHITAGAENCVQNQCVIKNDEVEILISETQNRSANTANAQPGKVGSEASKESVIYKIRVYRKPPPGPILGRWWINGGYPYTMSFSFINPDGNPDALTSGGGFPFDSLAGVFSVETGFAPGRWQLPGGINWSLVAQFQYARGDVLLGSGNSTDSGISASMNVTVDMFSMGGGLRIDRPFKIGNIYEISPMIGFNVHYQIFSHADSGSTFSMTGLNPEAGIIQYFRLGANSKWKISLTAVVGSYLYENQNSGYIRANVGVEYAIQ